MTRFDPAAALRLTLSDPRQGMRAVLDLALSPGERLGLMALMAVLNVLAAQVFARLLPEQPDASMAAVLDRPLVFAALQFAGLYILAGLIHAVGRAFGGQGSGAGAQMVILWLHVLFLILQIGQILALVLIPPLSLLLSLATLGAALWFLPHFVAELHGFRSPAMVFLGILGTLFVLTLLLTLALIFILGPEA